MFGSFSILTEHTKCVGEGPGRKFAMALLECVYEKVTDVSLVI